MKTITLDLKSFCFGVFAMGAVLLMANKPATQPTPPTENLQRYQAYVAHEKRTVILDTQTGRFLLERPNVGLPTWEPMNFEQLHSLKR